MMIEIIISILLILGAVFMLLSAIGLLRFPDLYTRMHATTKASTLGLLLIFAAICTGFPTLPVIVKSLLAVIYVFITTPVASHMIGRAGHLMKVTKWEATHRDDLEEADREDDVSGNS